MATRAWPCHPPPKSGPRQFSLIWRLGGIIGDQVPMVTNFFSENGGARSGCRGFVGGKGGGRRTEGGERRVEGGERIQTGWLWFACRTTVRWPMAEWPGQGFAVIGDVMIMASRRERSGAVSAWPEIDRDRGFSVCGRLGMGFASVRFPRSVGVRYNQTSVRGLRRRNRVHWH